MKKAQLIKLLERYDADAEILVVAEGDEYEIKDVRGTWDVADDGHTKIDSAKIAFIGI